MKIYNLLAKIAMLAAGETTSEDPYKFVKQITGAIGQALFYVILVAASLGTIYAVFLGIQMARANNAEKREEAKKRIIYCVVGIGVAVVLIILLKLFVNNLGAWGITTSNDILDELTSQ